MHDALDRRVRVVADRVGELLRLHVEFGRVGNELARDRIVRIARIDQLGQSLRQRHRVARGHRVQCRSLLRRRQTVVVQLCGRTDRCHGLSSSTNFVHGSTTGVHITCSMRCAPVASITSRSKPSAMPDACGIVASAARKSSSTG